MFYYISSFTGGSILVYFSFPLELASTCWHYLHLFLLMSSVCIITQNVFRQEFSNLDICGALGHYLHCINFWSPWPYFKGHVGWNICKDFTFVARLCNKSRYILLTSFFNSNAWCLLILSWLYQCLVTLTSFSRSQGWENVNICHSTACEHDIIYNSKICLSKPFPT